MENLKAHGFNLIKLQEHWMLDEPLEGEYDFSRYEELITHAADLDMELVWDMPVPYSGLNPVALELELEENEEHPDGAGKGWLYVEPDGDVLPAQGINKILGNFVRDEWESIWNNATNR